MTHIPTVHFTVRLPAGDVAELAKLAKDTDRSMSYIVRVAVRHLLDVNDPTTALVNVLANKAMNE